MTGTQARLIIGVFIMAVMLNGCSTGLYQAGRTGELRPGDIVDLKQGRDLTLDQLATSLQGAKVIFIGEIHDHPQGHQAQFRIIKALYHQDPDLVIGLELFERPDQGLLDRWINGSITPKDFQAQVEGKILSPSIYQVYEPLLVWARGQGVPLLALNAPRRVVSRVAMEGLESLDPWDRSAVARDVVVGPPEYRDRVTRMLPHHHGFSPDRFFTAQLVWDETMAETLTDYLQSPAGHHRRAVVIAGNEHIWNGYGVPRRTLRRLAVPTTALVMPEADDDEVLGAETADFAWILSPKKHPSRGRLGIEITTRDGALMVAAVQPDSLARRIGLAKGDHLVTLNQAPLSNAMDLHRAVMAAGPDNLQTLVVGRDGKRIEFRFRFGQN